MLADNGGVVVLEHAGANTYRPALGDTCRLEVEGGPQRLGTRRG